MRKLWLGILATLLVVVFVAPSFAWEFSMTGEFQWRQQYLSRMGNNDIFGDASVQDALMTNLAADGRFIGFAGPSIYTIAVGNVGVPAQANRDSGAGISIIRGGYSTYGDAAWIGDQRLTFNPSIRVNNAIRISGIYTVGGIRNKFLQNGVNNNAHGAANLGGVGIPPFERYGTLSEAASAYNTVAVGSWEQVRATIQVPWGTIAIGHRDFPFGTGYSFSQNNATSSTLIVVPYGPFRFLFATMLNEQATLGWDSVPDVERKLNWRIGPGVTYENGPLSVGTIWLPQFRSLRRALAPAGTGGVGAFGLVAAGASADTFQLAWNAFLKYNNGRFFANLEYMSGNATTTFNYSTNIPTLFLNAGLSGPRYSEAYKWMAEIGALMGPARFTAFAAYSSGQVLPGTNVNLAGNTFNATKQYAITAGNYQALQPYSFLMFPTYGGGNNQFNADGTGQMGDAFALAARVDYAAAANLNLWGSYIHARRAERNGYWAGSFNGANGGVTAPVFAIGNTYPTNTVSAVTVLNGADSPTNAQAFKAQYGGAAANMNPFVDDDFIGWEAQAGVDWKLLENFTFGMAYSYWQLGPWFDQAYQAFTGNTLIGGVGANGMAGGGILVGRDPIQAVRASLTIDF